MPFYYSHGELLQRLKELVEAHGQKKVAETYGFSPQYINDVLKGRRDIGLALGRKMGCERVSVFLCIEEVA